MNASVQTLASQPVGRPERQPIFSIRDLEVEFATRTGVVRAIDGVSIDVFPGETLGVVGETGSGKTVTMLAALGLLSAGNLHAIRGSVEFGGRDLLRISSPELRRLLGREIGMVFQDPISALNPVETVGAQIAEALTIHDPDLGRRAARQRVEELLALVGVPQPDVRATQYPHQFSGGMCQRAVIAMAIANRPKLLVADEPTTALDVSVQAQLLDVLRIAQNETGAATVLITHDLGVVADTADRVCVMYGGRVVETADVHELFARPRHPYTAGLLRCLPRLDVDVTRLEPIPGQPPAPSTEPVGCPFEPRCPIGRGRSECRTQRPDLVLVDGANRRSACHFVAEVDGMDAIVTSTTDASAARSPSNEPPPDSELALDVDALVKHYPIRSGVLAKTSGWVHAVDGVDLSVAAGETLALVGESGCGKSTTARMVLRLVAPTSGSIVVGGHSVTGAGRRELRRVRQQIQMVFQDPYASLNPRLTVGANVAEPMRLHGGFSRTQRRERVRELFERVGLRPELVSRFPAEFSGGQRQRVAIARALALEPRLVLLDEPVSALDVSVQAQVLNLLSDLQAELRLAYLFVSHDLSVVRHVADRVAVMYLGKIVEIGSREHVYERPEHPYTQALLSSVPVPDPVGREARRRAPLAGELPSPSAPPSGCRFRTRCPIAQPICAEEEPPLIQRGDDPTALAACHFAAVATPVEIGGHR